MVEGAGDKEVRKLAVPLKVTDDAPAQEMDKKALPKDYYNPAGSFDPLGMSR